MLTHQPGDLERHFDLAVVGAGITGVQIAREAACRGWSVLLVDRGDIGSGTSSATTKYIHGGIRYLEQYDFAVVRESLRERRIVALAAPHLVRQTPFLLPVWAWSRPNRWKLSAGAALYDALAFDRNRDVPGALRIPHPAWLGRSAVLRAVPWLDPVELRGAVRVTDTANLHPERLLLEFVLDAVRAGAVVCTHTEVTAFTTEPASGGTGSRVVGVELVDSLDGTHRQVRAERVVNAAGPWVQAVLDRVRRPDGGRLGPQVTPSKGVHVLTRPVAEPWTAGVTHAVMARAPSGRHVVVSPWQGRELIGPTDTPVSVAVDDVAAEAADVDEILTTVNACRIAGARLEPDDVDDVTVGIRPLVTDGDGDTYRASRRHVVFDHAGEGVHGLWSVAGGKWTTGRAVAVDVLARVAADAGERRGRAASPTERRAVPSAGGWATDPADVFSVALTTHPDVALGEDVRVHLGRLYGTRCVDVLARVAEQPSLGARLSDRPGVLDIAAQVVVAVADEGARTLADIVDRRLVLGTLGRVTRDELERVAAIAAPLLGRDGREVAELEWSARMARRSRWARPTEPPAKPASPDR